MYQHEVAVTPMRKPNRNLTTRKETSERRIRDEDTLNLKHGSGSSISMGRSSIKDDNRPVRLSPDHII
jgi:hypothetical protein